MVDRANDWLQTNIGVCEVKTCETVTWWKTVTWCAVNPQSLGDSEQMALSTSIARGSKTFYLRGFRSEIMSVLEVVVVVAVEMNSI